jgi:uncharacterized membrane-anchored protein
MRKGLLWIVLALILIVVNAMIFGKEKILAEGETMLLQLAPRDPRSLMQGDYMALRYSLANEIRQKTPEQASIDGRIVVTLDQQGVAQFVRLHDPSTTLVANERLLRFRKRGNQLRLASNAFFFQEGHGEYYRNARYGELRVSRDGEAVLVGLRDNQYQVLRPETPSED